MRMRLYITANHITTELVDVTLRDGYIPSLSDHVTSDQSDACTLEPAIWFKVMVIDALCIDCTKRVISWNFDETELHNTLRVSNKEDSGIDADKLHNTPSVELPMTFKRTDSGIDSSEDKSDYSNSQKCVTPALPDQDSVSKDFCDASNHDPGLNDDDDTTLGSLSGSNDMSDMDSNTLRPGEREQTNELKFKNHLSQSVYGDDVTLCGLDNDLDEVFDRLSSCLVQYKDDVIKTEEFHKEVKSVLHLSVLPRIKLTVDNISAIRRNFDKQESLLAILDEEIHARSRRYEEVKRALKKQRERFVSELIADEHVPSYPNELIRLLDADLATDIKKASYELERAQSIVDDVKTKRDSLTQVDDLNQSRTERDGITLELERCLSAREAMKELKLSRQASNASTLGRIKNSIRRQKTQDATHTVYLGLKELERKFSAEIHILTDKKVLIISVREAMRSTLDELKKGETTYGFDVNVTGVQSATDVLANNSISRSFQTLSQRVAAVLMNPSHPVAVKYLAFCQVVVNRCKAALYEKQLYDKGIKVDCSFDGSGRESYDNSLDFVTSVESSDSKAHSWSSSVLTESLSDRFSVGSALSGVSTVTGTDGSLSDQSGSVTSSKRGKHLLISKKLKAIRKRSKSAAAKPSFTSHVPGYVTACSVDANAMSNRAIDDLSVSLPNSYQDGGDYLEPRRDIGDKLEHLSTDVVSVSSITSPVTSPDVLSLSEGDPTESRMCFASDMPPNQSTSDSGMNDCVMIFDTSKDYIKSAIASLQRDIFAHFDVICIALQKELQLPTQQHYNKIWMAYDCHFYHKTLDSLLQLYSIEYESIIKSLCESIKLLTVTDLELDTALLSHILLDDCDDCLADECCTDMAENNRMSQLSETSTYSKFSTLYRKNRTGSNRRLGKLHRGYSIVNGARALDGTEPQVIPGYDKQSEGARFDRKPVENNVELNGNCQGQNGNKVINNSECDNHGRHVEHLTENSAKNGEESSEAKNEVISENCVAVDSQILVKKESVGLDEMDNDNLVGGSSMELTGEHCTNGFKEIQTVSTPKDYDEGIDDGTVPLISVQHDENNTENNTADNFENNAENNTPLFPKLNLTPVDNAAAKLRRESCIANPVSVQHTESTDIYNLPEGEPDPNPDRSVVVLRRHLSDPNHPRPSTVRRSIIVQLPNPCTIVYERTLCPVRERKSYLEKSSQSDVEMDASQTGACEDGSEDMNGSTEILCQSKSLKLKPKYRKRFGMAFECLENVISSKSPATKLKYLTQCLCEINNQISKFYSELYNKGAAEACTDELMDGLVILLCNCDQLPQLYCQVKILADIIPPFYTGGSFNFTVVQFVGACQFIQERLVMKKRRLHSQLMKNTAFNATSSSYA